MSRSKLGRNPFEKTTQKVSKEYAPPVTIMPERASPEKFSIEWGEEERTLIDRALIDLPAEAFLLSLKVAGLIRSSLR